MSKIGLLTFHESNNYGTCLQALALEQLINNLGYNVEILNYRRENVNQVTQIGFCKKILCFLKTYGLRGLKHRSEIKRKQNKVYDKFSLFRKKYFKYSKELFKSYDDLTLIAGNYDVFIVGSDMVWCYDRAQNLSVYFLEFADKYKRLSFSPSFGSINVNSNFKNDYKRLLLNMNSLSCREKSGIKLIKQLTNRDAYWTLDPTLVCDREFWIDVESKIELPPKYILVYLFEGIPKWFKDTLYSLSKEIGCEIVEIPTNISGWKRIIKKYDYIVGPEEFVYLFHNASLVITNSYHGLMFSLIFSKSFYILERENQRWGQFEDRLNDILNEINCKNRLVHLGEKVTFSDIDYSVINDRIKDFRMDSLKYLEEAITTALEKTINVGDQYE